MANEAGGAQAAPGPHGDEDFSVRDSGPIRLDGDQVRFALRVAGWSQAEFARKIGISTAHLSRVLNGQNGVSPEVMNEILEVFGGRVTWADIVKIDRSVGTTR